MTAALEPDWRVLIVDRDGASRVQLTRSLHACSALVVAASVGTYTDAAELLQDSAWPIDLMLIDPDLHDGSGLHLISMAMQRQPICEVLVISCADDDEGIFASIVAGANGYINKCDEALDACRAISQIRQGHSPVSPLLARRLLNHYRHFQINQSVVQSDGRTPQSRGSRRNNAYAPRQKALLSVREQEVLELVARGFSYVEISRLKGISVHTVQAHIKNLYAKLAVHSRSEAVFEATRLGLLDLSEPRPGR